MAEEKEEYLSTIFYSLNPKVDSICKELYNGRTINYIPNAHFLATLIAVYDTASNWPKRTNTSRWSNTRSQLPLEERTKYDRDIIICKNIAKFLQENTITVATGIREFKDIDMPKQHKQYFTAIKKIYSSQHPEQSSDNSLTDELKFL